MFHAMDIMRVNAFIAYNSMVPQEQKMEQKEFILGFVQSLLDRATALSYGTTRASQKKPPRKSSSQTGKRKRMSNKKPKLPAKRFEGKKEEHVETFSETRSTCKYCSYVKLMRRITSPTETVTVRNVYRKCAKCNVHLCAIHFDVYHEEDDNSSDGSSMVSDSDNKN